MTSRDVIKLDVKKSKFSRFLRFYKKCSRVSMSDVGFRRWGGNNSKLRQKTFGLKRESYFCVQFDHWNIGERGSRTEMLEDPLIDKLGAIPLAEEEGVRSTLLT